MTLRWYLLDVSLAPGAAGGVLGALYAVEEFGGGDRSNDGSGSRKLAQKTRHVEPPAFIGDEDRGVENQSHAGLSGGRLARACSRSSAKAVASSGGNLSSAGIPPAPPFLL